MAENSKRRCVVIGGAEIRNYSAVKKYLKPDDFLIYCDSGMRHREMLGMEPNLIVGDFDSWKMDPKVSAAPGMLNMELNYREVKDPKPAASPSGDRNASSLVLTLPHDKYDTDTVYGVREGMDRGYEDFLLIGMLGNRFDHSLSNLYILVLLDSSGKHGLLVDDYSEMELVGFHPAEISDAFDTFSLLNITGTCSQVQIENARYCYLPGEKISCDYQFGISNEVLPGCTARVRVGDGRALLIRNRRSEQDFR